MNIAQPGVFPGQTSTRRDHWRIRSIGRSFFRNRTATAGVIILACLATFAVGAPWISPKDPVFISPDEVLKPPSPSHLFGTDFVGRDLFARVIYGGRISLQVGVLAVAVAASIGVLAGIAAGFFGRWVDSLIMRIVDAILAFPGLLLAILLVGVLGPSIRNAMLAISITFIPTFARVVRAQTLTIREMEFILASRAIGASDLRVMLNGLLPNLMSPIIVQLSLAISSAILVEAGLSFLGLGVQPPTPAWGSMLGEGRQYITVAWWMMTFPGLAIFLTVLSFNFIGDGLREAFDPRQRRL